MKKIVSLLLAAVMLAGLPLSAGAQSVRSISESISAASAETAETTDTPDTLDSPDTPSEPADSDSEKNSESDVPSDVDVVTDIDSDFDSDSDSDTDTSVKQDTDSEVKKPEPPKDNTPKGDVNGDKKLTSEDALAILRYSVGKKNAVKQEYIKYADVNGDGKITSADALAVLMLSVDAKSGSSENNSKQNNTAHSNTSNDVSQSKDYSKYSRGIDVSAWQGYIDFNKVKASGIDFVIIRAGYGRSASQKDTYFETNYARAKAAGLKVGAYWYSYAVSAADAVQEANACMAAISGKQFDYPIYYDLEEAWQISYGTSFCTALVNSFCSTLEANRYYAGFYTSRSFATSVLTGDVRNRYTFWIAEWGDRVNYSGQYGMWQYGLGYVNGVSGPVDVDVAYFDFPEAMRDFHLNGY